MKLEKNLNMAVISLTKLIVNGGGQANKELCAQKKFEFS